MKVGKANYNQGNFTKKKYFKIKDGQQVYRILPPLGKLADAGKWSAYHRVEFGYVNSQKKMKPFLSTRVINRDRMVEVESEAYLRREAFKAAVLAAKDAGNIDQAKEIGKDLRKYNQSARHYYNVMTLDGEIGQLNVPNTCHKMIKALFLELELSGVDATGVESGRFVVINRSGTGLDTIYSVKEYKEKQTVDINGVATEVDVAVPHVLTEAILGRLANEASELSELFPTITSEQEKQIVDGDKTNNFAAIDEIFGLYKSNDDKDKSPTTAPAPTATAEPVATQAAPVNEVPVTAEVITADTIAAKIDTPVAKPVATPVAQKEAVTTTAPTADAESMSDDEFLASLGM